MDSEAEAAALAAREPSAKEMRLVIAASSAGTVFEWYDFFIYGTLAAIIGSTFFPSGAATLETLLVWAGFAVGFGFRPLGAVLFGVLGDRLGRKYTFLVTRVGRKLPIVLGYGLTLALLFPLFHALGSAGHPALAHAAQASPVTLVGSDCRFDPFASKQRTECGKAMSELSRLGVPYALSAGRAGTLPVLRVPGPEVPIADAKVIEPALTRVGYDFAKHRPGAGQLMTIFLILLALSALSGLTYGPVAALLSELFPPRVRYSSLSIPYHIGTGYFGGFLPLIAAYIAARTGDIYAGLWYTWGVVAMAFVVTLFLLRETLPRATRGA